MADDVQILPGDRPGTWLVRLGDTDQSLVDLGDPTHLAFDYVRRTGDVLDGLAPPAAPLRVVHVGGAGLTLPRYVVATRPGSAQVVLEPHEALTEQVREQVPLPRRSGIKVRPVDGVAGVAALRDAAWDVLVLDAYGEDGRTPPELLTGDFLADVARVVRGGTMVANISDTAPFGLARTVVAGLRAAFPVVTASAEPATLRGRRPGNLLLVAGPDDRAATHLRRLARRRGLPYRVLGPGEVSDALGGGTPARAPSS